MHAPFSRPASTHDVAVRIDWGPQLQLTGVSVALVHGARYIVVDLAWHVTGASHSPVFHRLFLLSAQHDVVQLLHPRSFHDAAGNAVLPDTWPREGCLVTRTVAELRALDGAFELYLQLPTSEDDRSQRLAHVAPQPAPLCRPYLADARAACIAFLDFARP